MKFKWYYYPLKPVAWTLLLLGDTLCAFANYLDLDNQGFFGNFRKNRSLTKTKWNGIWNKS